MWGALSAPCDSQSHTHKHTYIKHRYFFFRECKSFSSVLLRKMHTYIILQFYVIKGATINKIIIFPGHIDYQEEYRLSL